MLRRERITTHSAGGIGALTVRSLVDDPESTCLVEECRSLEGELGRY